MYGYKHDNKNTHAPIFCAHEFYFLDDVYDAPQVMKVQSILFHIPKPFEDAQVKVAV